MLNRLALKHKLIGGIGAAMLSILALIVFSVVQIRNLTSLVTRAAAIHEMTRLGTLASDLIGLERASILYSIFDDKSSLDAYRKRLDESSRAFTTSLDHVKSTLASESSGQAIETLRSKYEAWRTMHEEIVGYLQKQQVDIAQTKLASPAFLATVDEMRQLADEVSERDARTLTSEASKAEITSMVGFLALAVLSLGIGFLVLLYIRNVSLSLTALTDSLARNSHEVEELSAGVRAASRTLAEGSTQQAASLEETAASAEEITAVTRQNVENSQTAAAEMGEVDELMRAGNRTLESMLVSMNEIHASSDRISKIIKVIDEIAFQTNILALNAAVEAARAGEAGMGFAVVADEVRNLAQRSAQAARDTAAMIQESIEKSNGGGVRLRELSDMIRTITTSAAKVKKLVDGVNSGSQEQARGIEQIARAVARMDQSTQSAAISAQQSAGSSDKLAGQAASLNEAVLRLRSLVGAGTEA